jgi:hypothetical protein
MNIADVIAALTGGQSPDQAVMNANGAMPPAGPPPSAAPSRPANPTAPQGVPTPVTNPAPQASVPQSMQSPPDLANMYVKLMKDNQNARSLDQGLTLMAAGLSNNPGNRAALISSASGGGSGGMSLSANDIINFDKQRQATQDVLIRRAALPALMKQYNMSEAQIKALEAGGKLDEVLANFATRSLAHVTDANGQVHLVDDRTESGKPGRIISTIGSEKEDPTQYVNGPNGMELRNTRTGEKIGQGVGLPPDKMVVTHPDGSQFVIDKNTPEKPGIPIAPKEQIGDKVIPQQNELAAINAARTARGEAPLTAEELIKLKQAPATNINVSADGTVLPKPEQGYDYERGADGKPTIDPVTHQPKLYKIQGGSAADEAAEKLKKEGLADEKKSKAKVGEVFTASNVGEAIKDAMEHVDKPGVVGVGSKAARTLTGGIGGTPQDKFDNALKTVTSNITIQTLAQMRAASPTGGALGNVSDYEDKMLQSVIAPLATYGDAKTMKKGLVRVQAAMELLADDNFNKDPAKFQAALDKRMAELASKYDTSSSKPRPNVQRIN